jgi:hypothetical protein
MNAYHRANKVRTGYNRARQRAFRELSRRYPEAYRSLREEEFAKEPGRGAGAYKRAEQRAFTRLSVSYHVAFAVLFEQEKGKEAAALPPGVEALDG